MAKRNFEEMSIDELIDYKQGIHDRIEELRDEKRAANDVLRVKIERQSLEDRIRAAGLEGQVVLTPEPANLAAKGN